MKKGRIIGSLLSIFILLMIPTIPAFQLKTDLLTNEFNVLSIPDLKTNNLLLNKDIFIDDNHEQASFNPLRGVFGFLCMIYGAFSMYFGSGKYRALGTLIFFFGFILVTI
jgi:hypothetical protein